MNEQIAKILQLVEEGKISAHDAQGLIEAINKASGTSAPAAEAQPVQEPVVEEAVAAPEAEAPVGEPAAAAANMSEGAATGGAAQQTPPPQPPGTPGANPFSGIVDAIEKIGKEVTDKVDWKDVGDKIRKGAEKGIEQIKSAAEQIKEGKLGFVFGEIEKRDIILPLTVAEGKTLRVENMAGDVRVNCQAAEGRVTAHATFRGETRVDAVQKSEAFSLMIEESDHLVIIRQPDSGDVQIDFSIELPSGVPVEMRTESGDLVLIGGKGACKLEARSGDLTVQQSEGSIDVTNSSGDVNISQTKATLINVEGKSGNITLRDVEGNLTARTASGDFIAERFQGKSISVEAVTGDIRLDYSGALDGSVTLRTVSGATDIGIADGANCRVSLSTVRGDVHSAIELEDTVRQSTRITGRLGEGAGSLDVSAVNGDILLRLRNQESAPVE